MNYKDKFVSEDGRITLYNMDCMEFLAQCKENEFDLAIVDPPYGINADKKNSSDKKQSIKSAAHSNDYGNQDWDSCVPDENYFLDLKRVAEHQIIWGVNYYPYGLLQGGRIYWNKCVTMPTYSDGEIAYFSKINSVKSYEFAWHGMIQGDMKNKEKRIHPTQKPVKLYQWLLDNYAKPDQTILDTHLGSGSSAIAAHYYGCKFVGMELDTDYFNAAVERFKKVTAQADMFSQPVEVEKPENMSMDL